ncbi:DUF397 domain-containing protein [Streptomyces sp. NPDC005970]|uniref:DUF397 domain-containing protein n=1 Tax=Streptomyces sp. NPDC005970 TaxID=3156723 RepID=UPI0033CB2222
MTRVGEFLDAADEVLGAFGVLRAAKEEVAKARLPAFFRGAARLEAQATEFHAYECLVVNGLLQTEDYARAVLNTQRPLLEEETVEQRVAARPARQELLNRRPSPIMSFVTEEAVPRRQYGSAEVLRGQLERLLHIGQMRSEGGMCVEVATGPTAIHIRDSKHAQGPQLAFHIREWGAFIGSLSAEEFDA